MSRIAVGLPYNVLDRINDPLRRRWRVVAVDGRGYDRLNDQEIHRTLASGAVLRVRRTGEVALDARAAAPLAAGAAAEETVEIAVEADDGPALLTYETDGSPWVRGPGTRLTARFPVRLAGYAAWRPADVGPSFSLTPWDPATWIVAGALTADEQAQEEAKDWRYLRGLAFGGIELAAPWYAETGPQHPYDLPRIWRRRTNPASEHVLTMERATPQWQSTAGQAGAPADVQRDKPLSFSAPVPAATILFVMRRDDFADGASIAETGGEPYVRAGGSGALFRVSGGSVLAEAWVNGRKLNASPAATMAGQHPGYCAVAIRFATAFAWTRMFGGATGALFRGCTVREAHFVPASLSDAEIERWMGYAAHRHDIAHKLPGDHPFRWSAPGFAPPPVEPSPTPAEIAFGRFTLAGAGGVPVAWRGGPKGIVAGDPLGHWEIVEGRLRPTAAFAGARPAAGTVYALLLSNGDRARVTVTADEAHARDREEALTLLTQPLGQKPSRLAVVLRDGRYVGFGTGAALCPAGGLTLRAERWRRAVFDEGVLSVGTAAGSAGELVMQGLRSESKSGPDGTNQFNVSQESAGRLGAIRDCEAFGDWLDPTLDYRVTAHNHEGGISCSSRGDAEIADCLHGHVNASGSIKASGESRLLRSTCLSRFGDGVIITPSTDYNGAPLPDGRPLHRFVMQECVAIDSIGTNAYYGKPHADWTQSRFGSAGVITVDIQRCFNWQSLGNRDHNNSRRQGERGLYLEGSNAHASNAFHGIIATVVQPYVTFEPLPINPGNIWGVLVEDLTMMNPFGSQRPIGEYYQGGRIVTNTDSFGDSAFLFHDYPAARREVTLLNGLPNWPDSAGAVFTAPGWSAEETAASLVARYAPVPGGPLDLGAGRSVGAITPAGALKPLHRRRVPLPPLAPEMALSAGFAQLTAQPAPPPDPWGDGWPVTSWDLAWNVGTGSMARDVNSGAGDQSDVDGPMRDWRVVPGVSAGSTIAEPPGGATVFFRVRANNAHGKGLWSLPRQLAIPARAPAPMVVPGLVGGNGTATVTQAPAPEANGAPITRYDLRHSADGASWTEIQGATSPMVLTGLPAGTRFAQTRAVNTLGEGAWSPSGQGMVTAQDWTPADLGVRLVGWLDPADESTLTPSTLAGQVNLTAIADKSSLGGTWSFTGTPTSGAAAEDTNGRNVIVAGGGVELRIARSLPNALALVGAWRGVVSDNTNDTLVAAGTASQHVGLRSASGTTFNGRLLVGGIGTEDAGATLNGPNNTPSARVVTMRAVGSSEVRAALSGGIVQSGAFTGGVSRPLTGAIPATGGSIYAVGGPQTTNRVAARVLGLVAIDLAGLTTAEQVDRIQRAEGWLAHRWGAQATLAAGHPYRLAAP